MLTQIDDIYENFMKLIGWSEMSVLWSDLTRVLTRLWWRRRQISWIVCLRMWRTGWTTSRAIWWRNPAKARNSLAFGKHNLHCIQIIFIRFKNWIKHFKILKVRMTFLIKHIIYYVIAFLKKLYWKMYIDQYKKFADKVIFNYDIRIPFLCFLGLCRT